MSSALDSAAMNFSWVEDGLLAGCRGPRTMKDLRYLASQGIRLLVRLASQAETGISKREVERGKIADCYEPMDDFTAPPQEQIDRIVTAMRTAIELGKPVAVSCMAGYGRSATLLACYLVSRGHSDSEAIRHLIFKRPCSAELLRVPGQKEAVSEFYRRFKRLGFE
jgi:atypical dual specificity phosphatase